MLLVERDLPVGRLGLAESPDRRQTIRPKIGEDVLDPPEAVSAGLHLEPDLAARGEEVLLDVAGHQPPLFHFGVRPLEGAKIHVRFRQRDASCLLVLLEAAGINLRDPILKDVRVRQALARLPEADREILLMRNFEGLTNQEVGGARLSAAQAPEQNVLTRISKNKGSGVNATVA